MRRCILLSLAVAPLLGAVLAIAGPLPCDLTVDGLVDEADVELLEGIVSDKAECPEGVRCDIDGDREVAEADLDLLRQVVAGIDVCPSDGLCPKPTPLQTTVELCTALHPGLAEELRLEAKNQLQVDCEEHCRKTAGCHLRLREVIAPERFWSKRTGKCDGNLPSFGQTWQATCRCTRR